MVKLYKQSEAGISYWEAWEHNREITFHTRRVGETGQTHFRTLKPSENAEEIITNESNEPRADGFAELPPELHTVLVVQCKLDTWGSGADLDRRREIEDIANETLGWTGNGHCDGGDIGGGVANVFCYVIDPDFAVSCLVTDLSKRGRLEGAIIAVETEDDFKVCWPASYKGTFDPLFGD